MDVVILVLADADLMYFFLLQTEEITIDDEDDDEIVLVEGTEKVGLEHDKCLN